MQSQIELQPLSTRVAQPVTRPARTGFLSRLSVAQKLGLIAAAFIVPVAVPVGLLVSNQQSGLRTVATERNGIQYLGPLEQTLKNVQLHRRSASKVLNADTAERPNLLQLEQNIDSALATLNTVNSRQQNRLGLGDEILALNTSWQTLRDQVRAGQLTVDQSTAAHTRLIESLVQPLFSQLADSSQIALDPDADTYYLGQLATSRLPDGIPTIGLARTLGSTAIALKTLDSVKRTEFQGALNNARAADLKIGESVQFTLKALPAADRANFAPDLTAVKNSVTRLLTVFENDILNPSGISISKADFTKVTDASFNDQYAFYDRTISLLGQRLAARETRLQNARLLSLLLAALAVGLALLLLFAIARAITRPLRLLAGASGRLAAGDLDVQVPVTTSDEVGTVSTAFNTAVTQLRVNEEKNLLARQESEKLQANVGEFLDVTMDIADGDLTRRGKVTEDVLGNVVDSINLMTEELGQVLRGVQQASRSVTDGSAQMLTTTADMSSGAQLTATEAGRVAGQVQTVIGQIREMAVSAQASAESARQALLASQQGQTAVEGTLGGMQNIRREVQGVARRIKGLGDRSLEIQEIVDTISQIASQTNLLALNAAIEAAGAGEAGSRFAVVADEVRKLADNSAQATARIASLIRSVQTEIQDVIVSVEDGTREVEQGYKVAGTAGERLREIGALAQQSASLAESISSATQMQVQGMEQVGGAVQEIAQIADRSRASALKGRLAADQLQTLATQMNVGLARFRLPG